MTKTITITNDAGITFTARRVEQGDKYGLNFALTHDKAEPMIEFYDASYAFTEFGQFVTRYYASTIAGHRGALCLDGGVKAWNVNAANVAEVVQFLCK